MSEMPPVEYLGFALYFSCRSIVKEIYKQKPVTSLVLSTQELITYHTDTLMQYLLGRLNGTPEAELLTEYENKMTFIQSVTKKL